MTTTAWLIFCGFDLRQRGDNCITSDIFRNSSENLFREGVGLKAMGVAERIVRRHVSVIAHAAFKSAASRRGQRCRHVVDLST